MGERISDLDRARAAKQAVEALLRDVSGVRGLGITKVGERYAVKVLLSAPPEASLPKTIDGVPLVVTVSGPIRKQSAGARRAK